MQKRQIFLVSLVAVIFMLLNVVDSGQYALSYVPKKKSIQDSNITFQVELCKLWGAIKYTHPFFVYKHSYLYWDSALVTALQILKTKPNRQGYHQALHSLLRSLGDRYSYIQTLPDKEKFHQTHLQQRYPALTINDKQIGIIKIPDYKILLEKNTLHDLQKKIEQSSEKVQGYIVDMRQQQSTQIENDTTLALVHTRLLQIFATVLGKDIQLPPEWYRVHIGYEEQLPYTRKENTASVYLTTIREKTRIPLVTAKKKYEGHRSIVLVDTTCFGMEHIFHTLQNQYDCLVYHQGMYANDTKNAMYGRQIPYRTSDGIRIVLRTTEFGHENRLLRFIPDSVFTMALDKGSNTDVMQKVALKIIHRKSPFSISNTRIHKESEFNFIKPIEPAYPTMQYPQEEYRLLALFRAWNVIHYFFAYKHLMDKDWDSVLVEMLPRFQQCADSKQYKLLIENLSTYLQDSHAQVGGNKLEYFMPIVTQIIEGECVIITIKNISVAQTTGLRVGDIIKEVNGKSIKDFRDELRKTLSVSTPQALENYLRTSITSGPPETSGILTIQNAEGVIKTVNVPYSENPRTSFVEMLRGSSKPTYSLLSTDIGYIDVTQLTVPEITSAMELMKDVKGIVLDVRGYPKGTGVQLTSCLFDTIAVAAIMKQPILDGIMYSQEKPIHEMMESLATVRGFISKKSFQPKKYKIVALIDERALSQSEHSCLYFKQAGAVFVGSPTNGVNGNITATVLPGVIPLWFTGMNILHADGRQLQRIGIQPDVLCQPTIAGIRAGRDEVLDKGIEVLQTMIHLTNNK